MKTRIILFVALEIIATNVRSEQILPPYFSLPSYPSVYKSKSLCDENSQSSVIENFFSTVFAEFASAQPACVCIQLCLGQSTFCYPNGCFQHIKDKDDTKKPSINPAQVEHTTKSNVHDNVDMFKDIRIDSFIVPSPADIKVKTTSTSFANRFNPFKDRFQLLTYLKYKHPKPVLDHHYESDELLTKKKIETYKNTGIDITRTKWPISSSTKGHSHINDNWSKEIFTKIDKDTNKDIITSPFDIEEQINSFTKTISPEDAQSTKVPSKPDEKFNMDFLFFNLMNENKPKDNNTEYHMLKSSEVPLIKSVYHKTDDIGVTATDNKSVVTPQSHTHNRTFDIQNTQQLKQTKHQIRSKPVSDMINIMQGIAAGIDEEYTNTTKKTLSPKRLQSFNYSNLKNQMGRKQRQRIGIKAQSHLANKKRFRVRPRERQLSTDQFDIVPNEKINRHMDFLQNKKKRNDFRDLSELEIDTSEIEIISTTLSSMATDNPETTANAVIFNTTTEADVEKYTVELKDK